MNRPLIFALLISLFASALNGQPTPIFNTWKLVEVYELDTTQTSIPKSEFSAATHREVLAFNHRENGIEQSLLRIMPQDSTVYFMERKLDNDFKLKPAIKVTLQANHIIFAQPYNKVQIVEATSSLLILGWEGNRLEVYVPENLDITETGYDDYYIWDYVNKFLPRKFKISDGGATLLTKQN